MQTRRRCWGSCGFADALDADAQASTAINFKWQIHENWMKTCAFHWCRFSGFAFAASCVTGSSKNDFWMSLVFNLFFSFCFRFMKRRFSPLCELEKLFLLQFKSRRNPIWCWLKFKFRLADGFVEKTFGLNAAGKCAQPLLWQINCSKSFQKKIQKTEKLLGLDTYLAEDLNTRISVSHKSKLNSKFTTSS